MNRTTRNLAILTVLVGLSFLITPAFASNVLDQTTDLYKKSAYNFGMKTQVMAEKLLYTLLVIQIGIKAVHNTIKDIGLNDIIKEVVTTIVTACFFTWLIHGASWLLPAFLNFFYEAGKSGTGLSDLTPSVLIDQGFDLISAMQTAYLKATGSHSGFTAFLSNPQPALEFTVIRFIIFISYVILAFQMVMTLISSYFWMATMPLILGFAGISYTRETAVGALTKGGITIGMKILVTYLLAGVADQMGPLLASAMGSVSLSNLQPIWFCAAAALIFAGLAWSLPKLASDLVNGTASLSAGETMGQMAMAAGGAAALAMGGLGAAKAAGALGGNIAAEATGVAKALGAGMESAADHGKSGLGAVAHAVGQAGSHGMGMMSGALGEKLAAGKTSFAGQVENSAGGKVASSIQSGRGGSMAGAPKPVAAPSSANDSASNSAAQSTSAAPASSGASNAAPQEASASTAPTSSGAPAAVSQGPDAANTAPTSSSTPASDLQGLSEPGKASALSDAPAPAAQGSNASSKGSPAASSPAPAAQGSSEPSKASASTGTPGPAAQGSDIPSTAPAPSNPQGSALRGDGSTASIGGGNPSPASTPDGKAPLHQRMKDLGGYIPNDGHTVALNASINTHHE